MKHFDELTKAGRAARLRKLVPELLANEYGLTSGEVTLLSAHSVNTLFLCDITDTTTHATPHATPVILRVGPSQPVHPPGSESLESVMLASTAEMTELPVARMLPSQEGSLTTTLTHHSINGTRTCSLFSFVPGRGIKKPTTNDARALGQVHASVHMFLHEAFSTLYLLSEPALELRSALYFHNRNTLYTYDSAYGSLFQEAISRVQAFTEQLWRDSPHLPHPMHGDFGFHNVLKKGSLYIPIDFQDCFIGFDVQDIGITLADFRRPNFGPFRNDYVNAYLAGYREVRQLPEMSPEMLDVFAAQRILNVMNLELNLKPHGFVGYIDRNVAAMTEWMR